MAETGDLRCRRQTSCRRRGWRTPSRSRACSGSTCSRSTRARRQNGSPPDRKWDATAVKAFPVSAGEELAVNILKGNNPNISDGKMELN